MKPAVSGVIRASVALLALSGCWVDRGGTGVASQASAPISDAGAMAPDLTTTNPITAADAAVEDASAPRVIDAGASSPTYCRYQTSDGQAVCRSYPSRITEASRNLDCDTLSGTLSTLPCKADGAVAYCDTPAARDYVQAPSCADARKICADNADWTCLRDDPSTLGNDRSHVVSCGPNSDACDLASNVCCVQQYGKNSTFCEPGATCAKGETSIPCDGAEDCAGGDVCCIAVMITVFQQTGNAVGQCLPPADCKFQFDLAKGQLELRVCHSDAECGQGQTCKTSGDFSWWGSCQ